MSILCNSTFTTDKFNARFCFFFSVVAISRGLSLSTESDQKAASLLIDTSPDDSEVGGFVLGTKSENK